MLGALGATGGGSRTVRAEVAWSALWMLPILLISCCCSGQARSEGKFGQLSTDLIKDGVFIVPLSSLCVPLRPEWKAMTMSWWATRLYDGGEAFLAAIAVFMVGETSWFDGGDFIMLCERFANAELLLLEICWRNMKYGSKHNVNSEAINLNMYVEETGWKFVASPLLFIQECKCSFLY